MAPEPRSAGPARTEPISGRLDALIAWTREHGPAGSDPYDGLNSPLAPLAGLFGRWGRVVFLQIVRRSPAALRSLARIPPSVNAKGVGLLASAHLERYRTFGRKPDAEAARRHLDWLEASCVRCGDGIGWGYPFDWAARAFFVPRNTPTIVGSSTIGKAFLLAHRILEEPRYLETARAVCRFIATGLHRHESAEGICFGYTPRDRSRIFNASLMGASLMAQTAAAGAANGWLELARPATRFVLARQRGDGSWPYGAAAFHDWIDGQHTGFILRDLGEILAATGWEEIRGAIRSGMGFYAERLIAPDGRPLHRLDRPWPADIHACAEAILVFSDPVLRETTDRSLDDALRVASWTFRNLSRDDGAFGYRRHRRRTDRTAHMRWGQAWMVHALVRLEHALAVADGPAIPV